MADLIMIETARFYEKLHGHDEAIAAGEALGVGSDLAYFRRYLTARHVTLDGGETVLCGWRSKNDYREVAIEADDGPADVSCSKCRSELRKAVRGFETVQLTLDGSEEVAA